MQKVVSIKFDYPNLPTDSFKDALRVMCADTEVRIRDIWDSIDERPQEATDPTEKLLSGIQTTTGREPVSING